MGKCGERQNKAETHSLSSPVELFRLLEDNSYIISNLRICSEDILELVTTRDKDTYLSSFEINVFIAAFTTAQARLKLYGALYTLQERVLYFDTDSVIFKTREGQETLPLGRFLGEFTNETPGDSIKEFVSGGAKKYGYLTKKGKTECKARGFSLNQEALEKLNYYTMKRNIILDVEQPLEEARQLAITTPDYFQRDQTTKKIKLTKRVKHYRLVFDKRVLDPSTKIKHPRLMAMCGCGAETLSK